MFWTTLPKLSLHGLDTDRVESLEHFIVRLCAKSGVPLSALRSYLREEVDSRPTKRNASIRDQIDVLEQLTNSVNLRNGTFEALKNVAGPYFVGRRSSTRRWCPSCYAEWDEGASYEPLIWKVGLLSHCPIHGCEIQSCCMKCRATQPIWTPYENRKRCVRCKERLTGQQRIRPPMLGFQRWVNQQICDVTRLCATSDGPPISGTAFADYLNALTLNIKDHGEIPGPLEAMLKSAARAPGKPSLRIMINLCAVQAIPVVQMLLAPRESAMTPLVDFWRDYSPMSLTVDPCYEHVRQACGLLRRVLSRCTPHYLPPMEVTLNHFHINRALVRDLEPGLYEQYERQFRTQASPSVQYRLCRAFKACLQDLRDVPMNQLNIHLMWSEPRHIALTSRVSLAEATAAFHAGVIYLKLHHHSLKPIYESSSANASEPKWLYGVLQA